MLGRKLKAQSAVDFMLSYGTAFLVIFIALSIVYKTGVLNTAILPASCTTLPGFSCGQYAVNATGGVLVITLAQVVGAPISINGIACSSSRNNTGDLPLYGNIHVTNSLAFYPTGYAPNGFSMYSGSTQTFRVNCYTSTGVATGNLGNAFFGYLWLNYTMPGYGRMTQAIATFTAKYT